MNRRALVLENDPAFGAELEALLPSNEMELVLCHSLPELMQRVTHAPGEIAMIDGTALAGLGSDEHRHDLTLLGHVLPLVLVLEAGARCEFTAEDLGVRAVLRRPLRDGALVDALNRLSGSPSVA